MRVGSGGDDRQRIRVLAVDDDVDTLEFLGVVLESAGFEVARVATADAARRALSGFCPDIVLLDVILAHEDGFDVLADIRQRSSVPVIMVTARAGESDRVAGLRSGADDYVVKPFFSAELVARIETVLRRTTPTHAAVRTFGRLEVHVASREVLLDGAVIDTTPKEFDLLAYLTASPGRASSREELLEEVWSSSPEWQDPATVTEHVRRLRLKIDDGWIQTVRGVGYRFDPGGPATAMDG